MLVCTGVKPPSEVKHLSFVWHNSKFVRTPIEGQINSESIRAACDMAGLKPVCVASYYMDGRCVVLNGYGWEFAYPPHARDHDVPVDKIKGSFWYAGHAYNNYAIQNTGDNTKWADANQYDGDTYCVRHTQAERKALSFEWNHRTLIRTEVEGVMNNANILAACKKVCVCTVAALHHSFY